MTQKSRGRSQTPPKHPGTHLVAPAGRAAQRRPAPEPAPVAGRGRQGVHLKIYGRGRRSSYLLPGGMGSPTRTGARLLVGWSRGRGSTPSTSARKIYGQSCGLAPHTAPPPPARRVPARDEAIVIGQAHYYDGAGNSENAVSFRPVLAGKRTSSRYEKKCARRRRGRRPLPQGGGLLAGWRLGLPRCCAGRDLGRT
jgi:hypothetical protein